MIRVLAISALSAFVMPQLAAAESFGAIAYSISSDKYGRSWSFSNRQKAETAALGFCKDAGGKRCEIAVWLEDSCGALAVSGTSKAMNQTGISWGFQSAAASHDRALSECEKRDGSGTCRIVASVCSNGN